MRRDNRITIVKAIGIILVVVAHTDGHGLLNSFIFEFHMPLFFICAGYFFSLRYLHDEGTFVGRRLKGLYVPFVKWSVLFLVLHNVMFDVGLLSEHYGNVAGGVTHPYQWHEAEQRLWNILFAMGGYDEFLAGAFWFFRALFVASILYLLLYKTVMAVAAQLTRRPLMAMARHGRLLRRTRPATIVGAVVCGLLFALCLWKGADHLKIPTLVQGGSRDLMGCFFFGVGFLLRPVLNSARDAVCRRPWLAVMADVAMAVAVLLFAIYAPAAMSISPTAAKVAALPLPALCGFLLTYDISCRLDALKARNVVHRFLIYCGNNTLIVFVLHIVAYKVVSVVKIIYYDMPWERLAGHMTIHEHADDLFWIAYTIAGVGVPLLLQYGYDRMKTAIAARRGE